MLDEEKATDGDAMQSSTNALTKKLHSTVMDVFGNYLGSDEDEYNKMLESLRNKQLRKQESLAPAKPGDQRGIIAKKLLEGFALHGDVCDKCVMPLMSYRGHTSCVVCKNSERAPKAIAAQTEEARGDFETERASATDSALSEGREEDAVNEELTQVNERRSQATQVYTSKILAGYIMQDQLCLKCDMPMMKFKDSIECVFCTIEAKEEASEPEQGEVKQNQAHIEAMAVINDDIHAKETPKSVKGMSQAEKISSRVRGVQSYGFGKHSESELEKDVVLFKIIEGIVMQGNQSGEVSETLKDYFSEKQQEWFAWKRLKDAEYSIMEAEAVAAAVERGSGGGEVPSHDARVVAEPAVPAAVHEDEKRISNENGIVHRTTPAAVDYEPSIKCSIGDSFFPSLSSMFASASASAHAKE